MFPICKSLSVFAPFECAPESVHQMNTRDQRHFTTDLDTAARPAVVDRATWQARELDKLRVREKAHTREGDAIAAAGRRLPIVEVDPTTPAGRAAGTGPG